MALLTPDPPQPPNPIQTAAASTSTNVATGVANAMLNNVNQNTPDGSLRYDKTSDFTWHDPYTNQDLSIPQFTATQSLSPFGQELQTLNQNAQRNLGTAGVTGSQRIEDLLASGANPLADAPAAGNLQPFYNSPRAATTFNNTGFDAQAYLQNNPDVMEFARRAGLPLTDPEGGDTGAARGMNPEQVARWHYQNYGQSEGRDAPGAQQQRSLGDYGEQQTTFGDAGNITRDYGPADNFSADRSRIEGDLYNRLNPQLQRERGDIEQRLADQGIRYGSEAYTRAMDDYSRQANDARLAVTQVGGQEQQRLNDMTAQRAGFQNAAQKQAYDQALGRGKFANDAQMQQFQETLQAGTFANQAQKDTFQQDATRAEFANAGLAQNMARDQQVFGNENQARSQYLNERYADRNQQFNEITALMSGSQVSNPNFVSTNQNNIASTDIAGLINNRFTQDMDTYKQSSANFNSLMGGIFGAMGGMVKSDRREKEDIEKVGTIFAAGPDSERGRELPIYEYSYKNDDPDDRRHVGPMAQDIEKIDKRAVSKHKGVRYINTTRMGSIMKVA